MVSPHIYTTIDVIAGCLYKGSHQCCLGHETRMLRTHGLGGNEKVMTPPWAGGYGSLFEHTPSPLADRCYRCTYSLNLTVQQY